MLTDSWWQLIEPPRNLSTLVKTFKSAVFSYLNRSRATGCCLLRLLCSESRMHADLLTSRICCRSFKRNEQPYNLAEKITSSWPRPQVTIVNTWHGWFSPKINSRIATITWCSRSTSIIWTKCMKLRLQDLENYSGLVHNRSKYTALHLSTLHTRARCLGVLCIQAKTLRLRRWQWDLLLGSMQVLL